MAKVTWTYFSAKKLIKNAREFILRMLQKVKMAIRKSIEDKEGSANLLVNQRYFY